MDKLSFHDSLRIYFPGILFSAVFYAIIKQNLQDISVILIPSLFVGFILNVLFHYASTRFFNRILMKTQIDLLGVETSFFQHLKSILIGKLSNSSSSENNLLAAITASGEHNNYTFLADIDLIMRAKSYDSSELAIFRVPKSFGIMYFGMSLSAVAAVTCSFIFLFINNNIVTSLQLSIAGLAIFFAAMFFVGAKRFLIASLKKELYHWVATSKEDLAILNDIANYTNITGVV